MWIKNLRQRKLQTALIFMIITICTTLLTGAMSIITSLEKPCYEFAKACNAVTVKVYPFTEDEEKIFAMGDKFKALQSVKSVEFVRDRAINENIFLNGKKVDFFTNLTEYNDKIFGLDLYIEGDKNVATTMTDNECILPVCISNEYDIHIGDNVTIELSDINVSYKVVAVYTDPFQTSTAFDSDILINKLPSDYGSLDIFIYGKEGATGAQIVDSYHETYDELFNGSSFTLDDRISNGLMVGRIIGAIFLSIGIIMLLVSALIIYYMIKNTMIADAKSIAVYKTMGYTSGDILFMYLKLYFIVVTVACILGVVCSVFVSNNILSSIYENMGQLRVNNSFLPGVICYMVTASFILFIITLIIAKAKNVKPVHALSGVDYGGIKKKKHYKGNSKLQFSAFGIAYRTFIREKKNAISIVITCIVTIFSVNFIVITLDVANNMKDNNDFWIGVDKSDVMISVPDSLVYDSVKAIIEQDSRTEHTLSSNYDPRVTMKWVKGMSTTSMNAFVYDDFEEANLPISEGRNPNAPDEIAITTKMAVELHKSIGDYIEIYLTEDIKADMLITGFFQSYMQFGRLCRLTTSTYTEYKCNFDYNNISVYLKDSKETNNFIKDIKAKIGGKGNVIKRTEQFASIMNMIAAPQQKAIPPVAGLIVLIAAINIFSIIFLKNLRAQKINGIYKCIGYTSWHLIFSNLCYVIGIALVSIVIAFPISLNAYSPIMKLSLSTFHFTEYPMQVNTAHLLLANVAVIIIFIVSTLASSKALFKVNARDLVQE